MEFINDYHLCCFAISWLETKKEENKTSTITGDDMIKFYVQIGHTTIFNKCISLYFDYSKDTNPQIDINDETLKQFPILF